MFLFLLFFLAFLSLFALFVCFFLFFFSSSSVLSFYVWFILYLFFFPFLPLSLVLALFASPSFPLFVVFSANSPSFRPSSFRSLSSSNLHFPSISFFLLYSSLSTSLSHFVFRISSNFFFLVFLILTFLVPLLSRSPSLPPSSSPPFSLLHHLYFFLHLSFHHHMFHLSLLHLTLLLTPSHSCISIS